MNLDNIITTTLSRNSLTVSQQGFGTPALLVYHTKWVDLQRLYDTSTVLATLTTEGFATTDPAYMMAAAVVSQSPRPPQLRIIRKTTAFTQDVELSPLTFAAGQTISFSITKDGTTRSYTRACGGGSLAAEATAIAVLLNADVSGWGVAGLPAPQFTAVAVGNVVEIDVISPANDGEMWFYSNLVNCGMEDVTPDEGIAAMMNNVILETTDFYGITQDSNSAAQIAALAGWAETNRKLHMAQSQDYEIHTSGAGDIATTLSAASRNWTALIHSEQPMSDYPACAWLGRMLPETPGSATWAYKNLSGITADQFTASELGFIEGKACNHYTETAGVSHTYNGIVAADEFIDIVRLSDETVARVQESIMNLLVTLKKIPYTNKGISLIKGECLRVIQNRQPEGFVEGSEVFSAPDADSVSASDKANRLLPDVTLGAQFAGAIHLVEIAITLSF